MSLILTSACSKGISTDEIIKNVKVEKEKNKLSFSKYKMESFYEKDGEYDLEYTTEINTYKDGDRIKETYRSEDIYYESLEDDKEITYYYPHNNTLMKIDKDEILNKNRKIENEETEEFEAIIKSSPSAFDDDKKFIVENLGKEKINGYNTYHLEIKLREDDGGGYFQELWIDEEEYIIVKAITNDYFIKTILNLEEYEKNPIFDKGVLKLDYPDDVEIIEYFYE